MPILLHNEEAGVVYSKAVLPAFTVKTCPASPIVVNPVPPFCRGIISDVQNKTPFASGNVMVKSLAKLVLHLNLTLLVPEEVASKKSILPLFGITISLIVAVPINLVEP